MNRATSVHLEGGAYFGPAPVATDFYDPPPPQTVVSISADQPDGVSEGNSDNTPITFTITRTGDLTKSVVVEWEPVNFEVTGGFRVLGAANKFDYELVNPSVATTITFQPTETTTTIEIAVVGDTMPERDETLLVRIASNQATVTKDIAGTVIKNDDAAYTEENIVKWALRQATVNAAAGEKPLTGLVTRHWTAPALQRMLGILST